MGRLISSLAFASVALALGACGGTPSELHGGLCGVAPAPPQMTYPQSGATGVPDGNFTLVITAKTTVSLAINGRVVIANVPSNGLPPSPAPTQGPIGGYGYVVPALHAATTYQVVVLWPQSGCSETAQPNVGPQTIGTFTTQ